MKILFSILVVVFATTKILQSQELRSVNTLDRLTIGFNSGYTYNFDNRDKPKEFLNRDNYFLIPISNYHLFFRADFTNKFLKIAFNDISYDYFTTSIKKIPVGDIFMRQSKIITFEYSKKIIANSKYDASLSFASVFRFGQEHYIAGFYQGWEVQVVSLKNRDFGLKTGFACNYKLYNGIYLNTFTDFTYFTLRYENGVDSRYFWNNGTTKFMYRFMIGLSLDIWKKDDENK